VIGSFKISEFKPFDPVSKCTEAGIKNADGSRFKVSKSAPRVILALMANQDAIKGIFKHGWSSKKHLERIKTPIGSHSYLHK